MSKKFFEQKCAELEANGWCIDTYTPEAKFAIYRKNGKSVTVGSKK